MKNKKRMWVLAALGMLAGLSAVVVADPMDWFPGKPQTRMTTHYQMEPDGIRCTLFVGGWNDGAAEARIVPDSYDWPAARLPSHGEIRVAVESLDNVKTFRMSLRYDEDRNPYLFGSVPVGTFDGAVNTWYWIEAWDSEDRVVVATEGGWGFPEPAHWVPLAFD